RVSKIASLTVKAGALLVIALVNTQFAIDLQLIGGVFILQTLPALALGLRSAWLHRWALVGGLCAGLLTGLAMLYQIPALSTDGKRVIRAHFGGSAWSLSHLVHRYQDLGVRGDPGSRGQPRRRRGRRGDPERSSGTP